MSENNIDKLMKSMLENAQEEVPAHIWDGVSSGLDKAAKSAAAIVWWRRAAIGVAAAAAVAVGFVFGGKSVQPSEPVGEKIAVVEMPADTDQAAMDMTVGQTHPELVLMAEAEIPKKPESEFRPSSVSDAMDRWSDTSEETGSEDAGAYREGSIEAEEHAEAEKHAEAENVDGQKPDYETDTMLQDDIDWGEEEDGKAGRKSRTSLVLSGMTGTNSIQNGAKANIMKRPSLSGVPAQTGITETSTNTAYGIPVSVGAGVKVGLNDKWSLGVGANYSLLSRKFYGTFTKADNGTEISSTSSDIRNLQHFIGIPINAYRTLLDNKHINLYTYFGGTVEKCVADNYEILSTNITHTEKPSGVQISANIGLGVEFMIGKHLGLYADPSLRYYFDNGQPKSIRTSQPLMLGLDVGLRIKL